MHNQLISNLIQTQLAAAGMTANVHSYPTSQIYEWIDPVLHGQRVLVDAGYPDGDVVEVAGVPVDAAITLCSNLFDT